MSILEDSKKIVRYFLEQAIDYGNLDLGKFRFSYSDLAKTLKLKDGKYCRICCQYLREHRYMDTRGEDEDAENGIDEINIRRSVRLYSNAVDFLEAD